MKKMLSIGHPIWCMRFKVVFQPDGKRGEFAEGISVLEAARNLGVDINTLCGGSGACGKCVVTIASGKIPESTEPELRLINNNNLRNGYRLACSLKIASDMVITVPAESRTGTQRLQTEGLDTPVTLDPVINVEEYDSPVLGFAVDIGSTKLAGYLMDLHTGKALAVATEMNPQIPYGEDIISRITYAIQDPRNNEKLHGTLVQGIRRLMEDACRKAGQSTDNVYDTVLVGNTAMQHFTLGTDLRPLSRNPFMPDDLSHRDLPQETLNIGRNSRVHIPPLIAGFVGADCVAAILATGMHRSKEECFLMDIGTNTEIVVGNMERLVSCSCASGPAFEGAHIKHGMRAATGAIEKVWINPETLEPMIQVIGDTPPIGICGSGLIDLISQMLKTGIIDSTGRMNPHGHPRIRKQRGVTEYVVAWSNETGHGRDITITQLDVRELQKGKAAIYSGAEIAMNKLNLIPRDTSHVYIAGAFGTYIDRESAATIGMIPEFNPLNIEQVGNAAGTGARMMLLSRQAREEAQTIPRKVEYIELATSPTYNQEYLDALLLPHRDLSRFPETVDKLEATNWVKGNIHKKTEQIGN